MSEGQPRVRMFAGPNGSGKSSLKEVLPQKLQGVYLNPDELEKELKSHGSLDLSKQSWIAEVTDGKEIEFKASLIPHWFKVHVLDKISS